MVAATTVPPAFRGWLRISLVIIAGMETWLGLYDFPGAFDLHNAPLSFAQFLINAKLDWVTYGFWGVWLAGVGFITAEAARHRITLPVRFRLVREAVPCVMSPF